MLKQFYEKALPRQGVYCIGEMDRSKPKGKNFRHHFTDKFEEVFEKIDGVKSRKHDAYIAMGTFEGFTRSAKECIFHRSLFIDLDVGADKHEEGKGYLSKDDALADLDKFIETVGLPPPVRVDSGNGIHAYWLMENDIPAAEFLPYAKQFKKLCLEHLTMDPDATPADLARVMRWADSVNYRPFYDRGEEPLNTFFIDTEINQYDFEEFKEFLGEPELKTSEVMALLPKGLDEETRAMLKMDNFVYTFDELAEKSFNGTGCAQIRNILENSNTLPEPLWWAGLSVAKFCSDGPTAIHKMSEDYEGYSYEDTEEKASRFPAPRTCEWFEENYPEYCSGCKHRGKIKTPIVLGREFQAAPAVDKAESIWEATNSEEVQGLPDLLKPFVRGALGGIYFVPPPKMEGKGKDRKAVQEEPILIFAHDLYPFRRLHSPIDGECMMMRLTLPNDGIREFLLPLKAVYAQEKLKEVMSSNGILYDPQHIAHVMSYLVKWGQYMVNTNKADIMRMQMGWSVEKTSDDWDKRSFIVGHTEITIDGKEVEAAASPYVRGIAKFLKPSGDYAKWKEAASQLNRHGLEMHAFGMLCGFGSPLMTYTSTSGVTICFLGRSGSAKTGALYAGLSVFGNPKELSVFDATDNGMTGRYLGLHNLLLGVDEISNKDGKVLSQLVHKISHGKAKIRMQASVNAEREHEMAASLIAIFTSNESAYSKFESIKSSPDGETARLIEFLVKKPDVLQGHGGGLLGRQIFDTFRLNFGFAGPEFIKATLRAGDSYIYERMEYWRRLFIEDFGEDSTYRFYENVIMAAFAAGDIAKEAGIIDFDLMRIYKHVVGEMVNIREKVIKVNRSDFEALLGDFMLQNVQNQLVIKEGRVMAEPRGKLVARTDADDGTYQVSKTEFKKYLRELQVNFVEFETEMKEKGVLVAIKRERLTTGWKNAAQPENVWVYCFKTNLDSVLPEDVS